MGTAARRAALLGQPLAAKAAASEDQARRLAAGC